MRVVGRTAAFLVAGAVDPVGATGRARPGEDARLELVEAPAVSAMLRAVVSSTKEAKIVQGGAAAMRVSDGVIEVGVGCGHTAAGEHAPSLLVTHEASQCGGGHSSVAEV